MYYQYLKQFKPKKLAFIEGREKITYAEFARRIERCMGFLHAQGLRPGERVAFALANHSDFLVLFFATTAMGAVAVPLNIMLKASEYEYIFKDCQPALVVASAHLSEVFAAAPGALKSLASADNGAALLEEFMQHRAASVGAGGAGTGGGGAANLAGNLAAANSSTTTGAEGGVRRGLADAGADANSATVGDLYANNSSSATGAEGGVRRGVADGGTVGDSATVEIAGNSAAANSSTTTGAEGGVRRGLAGANPAVATTAAAGNPAEQIIFDDYRLFEPAAHLAHNSARTDLSHILYTSGTTGLPKGVMLSFGNLLSNIEAIKRDFRITARDRFIAYLPMFHSFTLTAVCMLPLLVGCTLVIKRSVMPFKEVIAAIFRHRVSILFCIPAILVALSKAKLPWYFRWFNRLRIIISGGSSLAPSVLEYYEKHWRRAALIEGYGLSECSPVVSVNKLEARKAHSVGTPLSGTEVMVVDEDFNALAPGCDGELVVRGECVMLGYLGKPEMTAQVMEGEWIRTGDIARIDEDGFIYIIDRKKDIIISKGINIYPREIEDIICAHPAINAAAVIGVKNSDLDESVAAYIELHEGESLTAGELLSFLRPKIAAFKMPKHVHFLPELPKNAAGKVLKKNLKERLVSGKN